MISRSLVLVLAAAAAFATGCGSAEPSPTPAPAAPEPPVAKLTPTLDDHGHPIGLHNFRAIAGNVTSGAQPEGEEAFRNLAALGFTTVVSVDGSKPDLDLAKKYGLHYVHIPTQYSGTTREQQASIAKAIEGSSGPVYVHCHHGKHRSPAASTSTCVSLGLMTADQATAVMKEIGTDPKYAGLYRDTAAARPFTAEERASVPATLPEYCKPDDMAIAMVDVDHRWDNLKACKEAKWGVPPKNPDVDPPHEARMLWEHFRELARTDEAKGKGEKFLAQLNEGEEAVKALEAALRGKDATSATAAFDRVAKSCASCHKQYRDN